MATDRKKKRMEKMVSEKEKLAKRAAMLEELKTLKIGPSSINKLRPTAYSNTKATKPLKEKK